MKKYVTLAVMCLALSGCGRVDRVVAGWTGGGTETCHKGVTYLQFDSGATVAVDRNGKPLPC